MGDRKEICVRCQSETLRLIVRSLTSSEVWPVMMSWMTLVTQFVSHNKQSFADPNNWRASLAPDMTSLNTLIALLLLCSFNSTFRSTSILSILAAKVCIVITVVRGNWCRVSDNRTIISAYGEIHMGTENCTELAVWTTPWNWTEHVSKRDTALNYARMVTSWNVGQDLPWALHWPFLRPSNIVSQTKSLPFPSRALLINFSSHPMVYRLSYSLCTRRPPIGVIIPEAVYTILTSWWWKCVLETCRGMK